MSVLLTLIMIVLGFVIGAAFAEWANRKERQCMIAIAEADSESQGGVSPGGGERAATRRSLSQAAFQS